MNDQLRFIRHRKTLIEFGELVLDGDNLQGILTTGCELIADAMESGAVRITKADEPPDSLPAASAPSLRLDLQPELAAAIPSGPSVLADEAAYADALARAEAGEAGRIGSIHVPILLPGRKPYGQIEVDDIPLAVFRPRDLVFLRICALILGVAIDRLHRVRDLSEASERFRVIVENARDYAILLSDEKDIITEWLPGAAAIFGWERDEILGKPGAVLFLDEDRERGAPERELEIARRRGTAHSLRWCRRKDGSSVCLDGRTVALQSPEGEICGYMRIGQDVTERMREQERTRESEERSRQFSQASSSILWIRDASTLHLEDSNPRYSALYGEELDGVRAWLRHVLPEDRKSALDALRRVRTGEKVMHEFRVIRHSDGEIRVIRTRDFPLLDEQGNVQRIGGIGRDVTQETKLSNRLGVVVAELQHRTRNLMAVVQSTADITLRASKTLDDFRVRFRDRLAALARVQGLLSRLDDGNRITFDLLIRTELKAVGAPEDNPSRLTLHGPRNVLLRSSTVQTLAMALHELATNAVKHGALGQDQAHLSITWSFEPKGEKGKPWLHVRWEESGVAVAAPSDNHSGGQGRKLIEQALPYQLDARTSFRIEDDGVRCTISIPVSRRNVEDGADD